jgi:Dolichyl-phosphate-mannose-protein mannosyltransferase
LTVVVNRAALRYQTVLLAGMMIGILALIAAPVHRLFLHVPGDSNEGWNAYHAVLALSRGVLYPPMDSLITTNYPPLSFYIVGAIGRLMGDDIIAGRLISLVSMLLVTVNVFRLTRLLGSGVFFAAFSAILFLLYVAIHASWYVAMNDPQWLGHAFITYGALDFFQARASTHPMRHVVLSSLWCVAGVLVKHNLIVLPLALFIWSALYDRRFLLAWTAVSLLVGLAAMMLASVVYGASMLQGIFLHQRSMSLHILEGNVVRFVMPLTPLLVYAALLGSAARRERPVGFALIYALVAGGLGLLFLIGRGCEVNSLFDLIIALCICVGLAGERAASMLASAARPWTSAAIGLVMASVCFPSFAAALEDGVKSVREDRAQRRDYAELIVQIASSKGPVACEMSSLCYWAGRDFDIDPHNYIEKIRKGKVDPTFLRQRIDEGYYSYIQATSASERTGLLTTHIFGDDLSRDVEDHYFIVRRVGDNVLLAPRARASSSGPSVP